MHFIRLFIKHLIINSMHFIIIYSYLIFWVWTNGANKSLKVFTHKLTDYFFLPVLVDVVSFQLIFPNNMLSILGNSFFLYTVYLYYVFQKVMEFINVVFSFITVNIFSLFQLPQQRTKRKNNLSYFC